VLPNDDTGAADTGSAYLYDFASDTNTPSIVSPVLVRLAHLK